jgi:PAS domain S-box-containing protein
VLAHSDQPFVAAYLDGRIGPTNRAFDALTGYAEEELQALDWFTDLTPPEWRDVEAQELEELRSSGRPVRYRKECLRKDGSCVPVELLANLVRNRGGEAQCYCFFVTDVTDRERREEMLRRSALDLAEAQRIARVGSWYWDPTTDEMVVSDELTRIFGQSSPLFQQQKGTMYPPAAWANLNRALRRTASAGTGFNIDLPANRPDGKPIWVTCRGEAVHDANGNTAGVRGTVQESTDRRRVEEAMRTSEEKFAKIFADNPAAIAISLLGDGIYVDVNKAWLGLFGYTREEVIGHNAIDLHIWPTAEERERYVRELRKKGSVRGWEQTFLTKSGQPVVALVSGDVLTLAEEETIISTLVVITARPRARPGRG